MRRILVTGNTGAGKTTVSKEIGKKLNLEVYSLDTVVWNPGWQQATPEQRKNRTEKLISKDSWVIDGVCSRTFKAADVVVFLDIPQLVCLKNVFLRFVKNGIGTRSELPENCPEFIGVLKSLRISFLYQRLSRPKILELIKENSPPKKIITVKSRDDLNKVWSAIS